MFEDANQLASMIDHTLVHPAASLDDLAAACQDARRHRFGALIVNGWHVVRAKNSLIGTGVKIGAVIGFPHGACTTTVKIVEAMEAMKNGAEELDIVMNLGMVKSGKFDLAEIDVKNVIAMTKGAVHKVIIECGALSPGEFPEACRLVVRAGAEFIKTSTGYGPRGATVEDVKAVRTAVGSACRIKASGGIRDLATVRAMVDAGAERIGTSSGPSIMEEYIKHSCLSGPQSTP
jgi:deoxyribose-phosphate aldolase